MSIQVYPYTKKKDLAYIKGPNGLVSISKYHPHYIELLAKSVDSSPDNCVLADRGNKHFILVGDSNTKWSEAVIEKTINDWLEEFPGEAPDNQHDPVSRPKHYTSHPSGIECIQVTRHMSFNLGNALKYIWRCDLKKDAIEDLEKAKWYIEDEIKQRKEREQKK